MDTRVPGEFLYWQRKDARLVRTVRSVWRALLGYDPAPSEEVVRTLASMYYDADPLAEDFVDEVYLKQGAEVGRDLLDRALRDGVDSIPDAPASLTALFADLEETPDWVDQEAVELGARVFRRFGVDVFRFAGAVTLAAYAENSVAKPLMLTGAYSGAGTRHRFLETASFWIDVSEPGGLEPGAPGRAVALRVRIMHVFVRRRLLSHPEWDLDAWGVPISQADALLTLMGGSVAPGLALQAMGYRTSRREIYATMHFWRYVGHLMGVRPRWFPSDLKEAGQLAFVTFAKGANRAGEDGRKLCQSYVDAFAPREDETRTLEGRVRAGIEHGVHVGMTRFFLPTWIYRQMEMPPAGLWALSPLARFPFLFAAETLRRRFPRLEQVADRSQRRKRRRWLDHHLAGKKARYRAVESFAR